MTKFYRLKAELDIIFKTAFHIGNGREGKAGSDSGVVLDANDCPFLPGSTLKGIFRSTVERLLGTLNLDNTWACGLENGLYSQKECVGGDQKICNEMNEIYQNTDGKDISFLEKNCCDVCKLFGSPLNSSRIYIDDAFLVNPEDFLLTKRDGVGIHRDSGTSVDQVKFNYDVANPELCYKIMIECENTTQKDLQILCLGLSEWKNFGIRIGGKTSRGLGHAEVKEGNNIKIWTIDMSDSKQRNEYLLKGKMKQQEDVGKFIEKYVTELLPKEN